MYEMEKTCRQTHESYLNGSLIRFKDSEYQLESEVGNSKFL